MAQYHLRVPIDISGATDTILLVGVPHVAIVLKRIVFWARAATNVILKDGTTPMNGAGFNMPAQAGFVYDGGGDGTGITPGNDFRIQTDGGALTGWVEFVTDTAPN